MKKKLRILVAPLDWGLGHATRCIPVIRHLLEKGNEVVIAAEGPVQVLLRRNFPETTFLPLPGYRVRYSRHGNRLVLRILAQLPKIALAIRRERRWLDDLLGKEHFDLIISDNRYGLYHRDVHSVILTHQLQILSGAGDKIDHLLRKLHYTLLEKFRECWVVDREGQTSLGGKMSHPGTLPRNACYIGLLSQFGGRIPESAEMKGNILVLLSGPEPMRSILEKKLLVQVSEMHLYRFIVVGGNPGNPPPENIPPHIVYHPYLTAGELYHFLCQAELVVCRSGYSTLMDLAEIKKKALLIPTPGQTEQEYLAGVLNDQGICLSRNQQQVDLAGDIPLALTFPGFREEAQAGIQTGIFRKLDKVLSALAD